MHDSGRGISAIRSRTQTRVGKGMVPGSRHYTRSSYAGLVKAEMSHHCRTYSAHLQLSRSASPRFLLQALAVSIWGAQHSWQLVCQWWAWSPWRQYRKPEGERQGCSWQCGLDQVVRLLMEELQGMGKPHGRCRRLMSSKRKWLSCEVREHGPPNEQLQKRASVPCA